MTAPIQIPIPHPGWDMTGTAPAEMVVAYLVMALEGCSPDDDETPVAVFNTEGEGLPILGVRIEDGQVQIVVQP